MNNKLKKVCAITLAVALAGAQTVWALNNAKTGKTAQPADTALTETTAAADIKKENNSGKGLTKDESVFVILNSDGSVKKQIVSSWLHSDIGLNGVQDISILNDIKNLKSAIKPEFKDGKLTWNSSDKDVYYQGTTDKPLPVNVSVTYKLDGEEITGEELAGKSGEVEIYVKVSNAYTKKQVIDGVERPIAPVFLTTLLLNLPEENFSNVKADDGIIMNESTNQLITFVTVPGLKDSFDGLLDDKIGDIKDKLTDEFVVTAHAQNFRLPSIMVAAANDSDLFDDDNDLESDIDELLDGIDDLNDATDELRNGTLLLADAGVEFNDNMRTFRNKYQDFHEGFRDAYKAINSLVGKLNGVQSVVAAVPPQKMAALNKALKQLAEIQKENPEIFTKDELELLGKLSKATLPELNVLSEGIAKANAEQLKKALDQIKNMPLPGMADDTHNVKPEGQPSVPDDKADNVEDGITKTEQGTQPETPTDQNKTTEPKTDASTEQKDDIKTDKEDVQSGASDEKQTNTATQDTTEKDAAPAPNEQDTVQPKTEQNEIEKQPEQKDTSANSTAMTFSEEAPAENVRILGDYVSAEEEQIDLQNNMAEKLVKTLGVNGILAIKALSDEQIEAICGLAKPVTSAVVTGVAEKICNEKFGMGFDKTAKMLTDIQGKSQAILVTLQPVMDVITDPQVQAAIDKNPEFKKVLANPIETMQKLSSGSDELTKGLDKLYSGELKISSAIDEFKDATQELQDKTAELSDGVEEFQIDGIYELTDEVTDLTDDLKQAIHIKEAISNESKGFTTYTGAPHGADTSVKFIMKTEEIKAKEEEKKAVVIEKEKSSFWDKIKGLFQK